MRAILPVVLLTACFLSSTARAQQGEGAASAAGAPLAVVAGPLSPQLTALLRRALPVHGDFGDFLLVRADAGQQRWLTERGLSPLLLGAWPAGQELAVMALAELAEAPAGAHMLYATSRSALVAVDAERGFATGCLHGEKVSATPLQPASSFVAPALPGAGSALLLATDSRIAPLLPQVSAAAIQATVTQLSSYFTRRADSAQVLQARDWILAQLALIPGLTVTTETFNGAYGPNIVATRTGAVHPERLVVLGAHYDSINGSGSNLAAPGADDNASGSGGLLEAARLLAQGSYENTVRCVWFCAEELGLVGSEAMAAALDAQDAQVVAMLNMDMIAHREAGDAFDLDFATNSTDPALVQFCRDITAAYVPTLPTVTGVLTAGSSDHAPFAGHGFPAAFYFEDLVQFSQVIHTASDTLPSSPNDFTLARQITQSFIAAAATLASPVDIALAHAALPDTQDSGGPYPLSVSATPLTASPVASVEVRFAVNGGAEQSAALLAGTAGGTWVGSLPGVAGTGEVRYWLLATDAAGFQQWLPDAFEPGGKTFGFSVGTYTTVFSEGFEGPNDAGWTHAQVATQDDWQRGAPQGKGGDPGAAFAGSNAWGNDLGGSGFNGIYQPNVNNWLESPAISLAGKSAVHLRYRRWLTVEDALFDQANIKLNGTTVWTNPATAGGSAHTVDTAWTLHDLDVSALADGNPSVKLRFGLQSDGGLEFGGWNLDEVQLASVGPGTVPPLVASALHVSAAAGGAVAFSIRAGAAHAGRKYLLALSASGTAPGMSVGSVTIPLNFDVVTSLGFQFLNTPLFANFGGFLDGQGAATATWLAPPGLPAAAAGLPLAFAAFTLGPVNWASNAVTVTLQP
jgi:hypothetical protein